MDHLRFQTMQDELRGLIAERLGIRAPTFAKAVRKAGRLLPAPARSAAQTLITMEARLAHPKLAARTDPSQIEAAETTLRSALERHRPGAMRAWRRSLLVGEIAFKIAAVIVAILVFLRISGLA